MKSPSVPDSDAKVLKIIFNNQKRGCNFCFKNIFFLKYEIILVLNSRGKHIISKFRFSLNWIGIYFSIWLNLGSKKELSFDNRNPPINLVQCNVRMHSLTIMLWLEFCKHNWNYFNNFIIIKIGFYLIRLNLIV